MYCAGKTSACQKRRFASSVLHSCNVKTQICVTRPQCANKRKFLVNEQELYRAPRSSRALRSLCWQLFNRRCGTGCRLVYWYYVFFNVRRFPWKYILINVQWDATICSLYFILLQYHTTCFGWRPHPSSGVIKTVITAIGTSHIIYEATSPLTWPIWPRWSEVAARSYDLYRWL